MIYLKKIVESISKNKIFYDLFFLMIDYRCIEFDKILEHDRAIFEEPKDWQNKLITERPLVYDFENI